ncbi:MAG: hypothetical protein Q7R95_09040 [bacterium]|nr:hypothetical protein [bacterium]
MSNKRIVWVEDSADVRFSLGRMFQNGFKRDGVEYEERPDLNVTKDEIKSGNLADVYILDNEITGASDIEGAQIAQEIYDAANRLGRKVIVVTLLCSNPKTVHKLYGDELDKRQIPVLQKLSDAPLIGFWIGACIAQDKYMSLNDWLKESSTQLLDDEHIIEQRKAVQNAISVSIMDGKDMGVFYQPPRDYIDGHMNDIKPFLNYSNSFEIMNRIFPPVNRKKIETRK